MAAGRVSGGSFVEGDKWSGQKMDTTRLNKWWNIACVSQVNFFFFKVKCSVSPYFATHEKSNWLENRGRDPFDQNFRKFWSNIQWIGSVQPEKFRKNWCIFWRGPLFPVGPVGILVEWIAPRVTSHRTARILASERANWSRGVYPMMPSIVLWRPAMWCDVASEIHSSWLIFEDLCFMSS